MRETDCLGYIVIFLDLAASHQLFLGIIKLGVIRGGLQGAWSYLSECQQSVG